MNRPATLALDSYRLAQYTIGLPCYLCGEENPRDAELCRFCFAPMSLAHQSAANEILPRLVATIGSSGAGKTVYLGMLLDMLSRQPDALHVHARGAFSITLQQNTVAALCQCRFPQKTPSEADRWNWVHCQVRTGSQHPPFELVLPDVAGEAILEEIEHPFSYRALRMMFTKCAAALLLIDARRLQVGTVDQDFVMMKLLCYLRELGETEVSPKSRGKATTAWRDRPIAVIFTKADECESCFEDPSEYAKRHIPGVWQLCRERFRAVRYFASGVAGACAMRDFSYDGRCRIPLRIEPRGIIEPFAWLVGQLEKSGG